MKNKNYKWVISVIRETGVKYYVNKSEDKDYTRSLERAKYFSTRQEARDGITFSLYGKERVEKISFNN